MGTYGYQVILVFFVFLLHPQLSQLKKSSEDVSTEEDLTTDVSSSDESIKPIPKTTYVPKTKTENKEEIKSKKKDKKLKNKNKIKNKNKDKTKNNINIKTKIIQKIDKLKSKRIKTNSEEDDGNEQSKEIKNKKININSDDSHEIKKTEQLKSINNNIDSELTSKVDKIFKTDSSEHKNDIKDSLKESNEIKTTPKIDEKEEDNEDPPDMMNLIECIEKERMQKRAQGKAISEGSIGGSFNTDEINYEFGGRKEGDDEEEPEEDESIDKNKLKSKTKKDHVDTNEEIKQKYDKNKLKSKTRKDSVDTSEEIKQKYDRKISKNKDKIKPKEHSSSSDESKDKRKKKRKLKTKTSESEEHDEKEKDSDISKKYKKKLKTKTSESEEEHDGDKDSKLRKKKLKTKTSESVEREKNSEISKKYKKKLKTDEEEHETSKEEEEEEEKEHETSKEEEEEDFDTFLDQDLKDNALEGKNEEKLKKIKKLKLPVRKQNEKPNILLGNNNFYDLVTRSDAFIDKTDHIADIITDDKILHFTRPKKWGRTVTLNMLKRFFELELDDYGNHLYEHEKINKKLFKGGIRTDLMPELNEITTPKLRRKKKKLAAIDAIRYRISPALNISRDSRSMAHLGKYPVMFFNFRNLRGSTYRAVMLSLKHLIHSQFKHYYWLMKRRIGYSNKKMFINYLKMSMDDEQYIKTGIGFLTKLIHKLFNKRVIFFIDDEDFPYTNFVRENYFDQESLEKVHKMCKEFIENLGEDSNIHKGIIFGTMHVIEPNPKYLPEYYMPYAVNNPSYNTLVGFTSEELDRLLRNKSTSVTKKKLKKWYSGYNIGGVEMYNPWSVLSCLENGGKLDNYWTKQAITRVLRKGIPRDMINRLIEDEGVQIKLLNQLIPINYIKTYSVFFKSLLHSGYLTSFKNKLYIPNKEIYNFYSNTTKFMRMNQTRSAEAIEMKSRKRGI